MTGEGQSAGAEEAPRTVPSGGRYEARVRVPPSKSVTNRYLNLALFGGGAAVLERPLDSDDTRRLAGALERLGFAVDWDGERLELVPGERPAEATIECGLSGTMARFLTATLAVLPGSWRLDGEARLRERPLGPLVDALRTLGAEIEYAGAEGCLPLSIAGRRLDGGRVRIDASQSSQYVSALLMAGTQTRRGVAVRIDSLTSAPYLDLTVDALRRFGVEVERRRADELRAPPARFGGGRFTVAGDYSAACYPAAAAVLTGGRVELVGLERDSPQGDGRFFALLRELGARVSWSGEVLTVAAGAGLSAVDADLSAMPDQVPTVAAMAPFASGTTRIRNVPHLRLKESDRLAAMSAELARLGVAVAERSDGLRIPGLWAHRPPPGSPVLVHAHGDHRIAMALALVGLRRPGVTIDDPLVVAKSYPDFWRDLEAGL